MSALSELVVGARIVESKVVGLVVNSEETKKVAVGLLKECSKIAEAVKSSKEEGAERVGAKVGHLLNFLEKQVKGYDEGKAAEDKKQGDYDKRIAAEKKALFDKTEKDKKEKAQKRK